MAYHVTVVLKGDSNERHVIESDDTTDKFTVTLTEGFLKVYKRSKTGERLTYTFNTDNISWYRVLTS